MGSGMSKVVTGLYLGNIRDSEDVASLRRHGVTHVLSVHTGAKPVLEDMSYLCISASDSSSQNLLRESPGCPPAGCRAAESPAIFGMQHFKECIKFIHECRLRGGGCLVHCLAGVSRSTTVLVAYLMTVTELGWERCLAATRAVRSYASPNPGFQQQLRDYESTLLDEQYRAWIHRDYGRNPFKDQEELQRLLALQEQGEHRESSWAAPLTPTPPLPPSRSRRMSS
ncbi:dual specificity protein phosphatase 22-A-like isoform X1 [Anas platyrhynchos]|uniref:dual specificity protein phosphatase 22-A-like isoform X1 n=1 Tax=Anas platyrhynchos TaxID=8839 RepID=UPI003AF2595A